MGKKLIVANWKSNKSPDEAKDWLADLTVKSKSLKLNTDQIEVVICPPFVDLPVLKEQVLGTNFPFTLSLGCQDVSPFSDGAYTGAVSAKQIEKLVTYCLIGHSERRKYFGETTDGVSKKIELLASSNIKPIICAGSVEEIPENIKSFPTDDIILMFEPAKAISVAGVYQAETPEEIKKTVNSWKSLFGPYQILYGGSVNGQNAKDLLLAGAEGFVIGHASLTAEDFLGILQNV